MAAKWYEVVTGSLEQKKQYRQYKARIEALPEPYRGAAKALDRYFMTVGGMTDGVTMMQMLGDSASAFAEEFTAAYSGKQWIDKERSRLNKAIDDAERGDQK